MRLSLLLTLLFAFITGCSWSSHQDPLMLKVGIHKDGQPFFDWNQALVYETNSNGAVSHGGARASGHFSKPAWGSALSIELKLEERKDRHYLIDGSVESPVPLELEFIGTSPGANIPETILYFPVGKHSVHFDGILYFLYK